VRYYGLSVKEVQSLPPITLNSLWSAIDVIEAQEQLGLIKALQFPQLTNKARSDLNRQLFKQAYPKTIYKQETKDVAFMLNTLGGASGRRK